MNEQQKRFEERDAEAWETQARVADALALEHEEEARKYRKSAETRRKLAKLARARAAAFTSDKE